MRATRSERGAVADAEVVAAVPQRACGGGREPGGGRKACSPAPPSPHARDYTGSVVAGAVIVLDPAIARSAAWRAHWADATAFDVVIDDEQIVLRRRSDG